MNSGKFLKTKFNVYAVLVASVLCLGFSDTQAIWKKTWTRSGATQSKKIISDVSAEGNFWLIASNALYQVDNNLEESLVLHKRVNSVYQSLKDPEVVYIAAEDGIYMRTKSHMQRLLLKHGCLSVLSVGEIIYAGTNSGLMIRKNTTDPWHVPGGVLAQEPITLLASYGNVVYVVTPSKLYRYDVLSNEYSEIFSAGIAQEIDQGSEITEDGSMPIKSDIIDVDIAVDGAIYTSTRKGIFYSDNQGGNWRKLPDTGLPSRSLNALSLYQNELWAATSQGVYRLTEKFWQKYDAGLETNIVFDLIHDGTGMLYAATSHGFFYLDLTRTLASNDDRSIPKIFTKYEDIDGYFKNEPTIRQVQDMAVHYADVHPDKIYRWHRQSRLKAFLPTLSTGMDRSATDLMHWDTGSSPDTLSKGKDFIDWDMSLSWDLGDLVWSSDQTSIDSRSKLMSELRQEVLDQVTRVYFERRRLQIALLDRKSVV